MPFHPHSLETSGKVCQFQQPGHTQPFNLQQSQNNCPCAPWGNLKLRAPPDLSSSALASLPMHLWGAPSSQQLCSVLWSSHCSVPPLLNHRCLTTPHTAQSPFPLDFYSVVNPLPAVPAASGLNWSLVLPKDALSSLVFPNAGCPLSYSHYKLVAVNVW